MKPLDRIAGASLLKASINSKKFILIIVFNDFLNYLTALVMFDKRIIGMSSLTC